jgi:excisionase family DNA binding protein
MSRLQGIGTTPAHSATLAGSDRVIELLDLIATELQSLRTAIESRGTSAAPDVLTAPQLADLLQVDLRTLRAMRHGGEIPRGFMCGRSPRWKRSQIDAWITTNVTNRERSKGR